MDRYNKISPAVFLAAILAVALLAFPMRAHAGGDLGELMQNINEHVILTGAIEVEGFYEDHDTDGESSDLNLATVELGIEAELHEYVTGTLLFLYEEHDTEFDIDEGKIKISSPYGLNATVGKMYIPFGMYNSHMVTDPQTLELGETNETAILLGYDHEVVQIAVGVYNGHVDDAGDNHIEDAVASIVVTPVEGVTFGGSFISDISDTDLDITGLADSSTPLVDEVGGFAGFISLAFGPVMFEGEYVGTSDSYDVSELDNDGDGHGDRPRAFNVELAAQVHEKVVLAVRYEGNKEFFDEPENQYGGTVAVNIFPYTTLALEYLHGEYEDDIIERDIATLFLGVEF